MDFMTAEKEIKKVSENIVKYLTDHKESRFFNNVYTKSFFARKRTLDKEKMALDIDKNVPKSFSVGGRFSRYVSLLRDREERGMGDTSTFLSWGKNYYHVVALTLNYKGPFLDLIVYFYTDRTGIDNYHPKANFFIGLNHGLLYQTRENDLFRSELMSIIGKGAPEDGKIYVVPITSPEDFPYNYFWAQVGEIPLDKVYHCVTSIGQGISDYLRRCLFRDVIKPLPHGELKTFAQARSDYEAAAASTPSTQVQEFETDVKPFPGGRKCVSWKDEVKGINVNDKVRVTIKKL